MPKLIERRLIMNIIIEADSKEIAALIVAIQERQEEQFMPICSEGILKDGPNCINQKSNY